MYTGVLHTESHSLWFSILSDDSITLTEFQCVFVTTFLDNSLGVVENLMTVDSDHFSFSVSTNYHVGWNFHPCVFPVFIHWIHDFPLTVNGHDFTRTFPQVSLDVCI